MPLNAGQTVTLPPAVAHHAERVLRMRVGDAVVLFNGRGGEHAGRIDALGKIGRVRLETWQAIEREAPLAITLVQALPAADKMDWIVQKAVELGVTGIVPVVSSRSVVRLSGERAAKRIDHLRQIAIAACEQCGRNRLPEIADLQPLPHYLAQPRAEAALPLVLALTAEKRLADLPQPDGGIVLLVGPEGGLTDDEVVAARSVGFMPVGIGPRILRTETAGLAAIAALQARWGDF